MREESGNRILAHHLREVVLGLALKLGFSPEALDVPAPERMKSRQSHEHVVRQHHITGVRVHTVHVSLLHVYRSAHLGLVCDTVSTDIAFV